jgi:hypothetical protein
MRNASGAALALMVLTAGCAAGEFGYVPETGRAAPLPSPAATYPIPPASPRGRVYVAALGIAELRPGGTEEGRLRAMHLRLVIENGGDDAWTVDTREQLGVLEGEQQSRPAFATASPGEPPIVTVAPQSRTAVDLYYPLPLGMQTSSRVTSFDLIWRVATPQGAVAERTSFDRVVRELPPAADPPRRYGWGWTPGWYDPFWPEYTFQGAGPLPGPAGP